MAIHTYLILIVLSGLLSSCEFFQAKEEEEVSSQEKPIARVGSKTLYLEDISDIFVAALSKSDSIEIQSRYVNSWVKKQLLLQKAENNLNFDPTLINRKVENYRYELMVYEYKKAYIAEKLNTTVADSEIEKFYSDNLDNFQLRQNIVKCQFIKIPIDAPQIEKAKRWFNSQKEKDYQKLKSYSTQFATAYILEDTVWFNFGEITKGTPFRSVPNAAQFLQQTKKSTASDSNYVYMLQIIDYKISDEISPLEFVYEKIKNIIINKRKMDLIENLEEGIVENAKENNAFEIYD